MNHIAHKVIAVSTCQVTESKLPSDIKTISNLEKYLTNLHAELQKNAGSGKSTIPTCVISYAWGNPVFEGWVRDCLDKHLCLLLGEENTFVDERNSRANDISKFTELVAKADRVIFVVTKLMREKYEKGFVQMSSFPYLSEVVAHTLVSYLMKAKLIDFSGKLLWKLDFEKKVESALTVEALQENYPCLVESRDKILAYFLDEKQGICAMYRKYPVPVLQEEISMVVNGRMRDSTKQVPALLLMEGDAKDVILPRFQSLPYVDFKAVFEGSDKEKQEECYVASFLRLIENLNPRETFSVQKSKKNEIGD